MKLLILFTIGSLFGSGSMWWLSEQRKPTVNPRSYQIQLGADGIDTLYDGTRLVGVYQSDTTGRHLTALDRIIWKDNE